MSRLTLSLRRFRRLVAPSARDEPARDTVSRDPTGELAPAFDAVDTVAAEAERIRAEAEEAATAKLADARERAETILAEGRERAQRARDEAAEARRVEITQEAEQLAAEAEAERARIQQAANERLPGLVEGVVARVRDVARMAEEPTPWR